MKIDPRDYEYGNDDDNLSFKPYVKTKKKTVPNGFKIKQNNKKFNKPKHIDKFNENL